MILTIQVILYLLLATSTALGAVASRELAVHWTCDEASGQCLDSSANGNNLTLYGGVSRTTGKVGSHALQFDGSSGYALADWTPNNTGDSTFAAWVWTDNPIYSQCAFYIPGDQFDGMSACIQGGVQKFLVTASAHDTYHQTSKESGYVSPRVWHHLVVVKNHHGVTLTIYMDGQNVTQASEFAGGQTWGLGINTGNKKACVGCSMTDGTPVAFWAGKIDDPQVYRGYAATAADVAALYNNGNGGTVLTLPAAPSLTPTNGPLRVSSNSRYFADASGKIVYLTGIHQNEDFQQTNWHADAEFSGQYWEWNNYLDVMNSYGMNSIRLWQHPMSFWFPNGPFLATGPGNQTACGYGLYTSCSATGAPKVDLTQYDSTYYATLRAKIIQARDRGIYVSILLFDGWSGLQTQPSDAQTRVWVQNFWNQNNNIQAINLGTNDGSAMVQCNSPPTCSDNPVIVLEENYVKHTIDALGDLDNIMWETCNECPLSTSNTSWQAHIIDLIHSYESTKAMQHPVGMTAQLGSSNTANANVFASSADWVGITGDSTSVPNWPYNPPSSGMTGNPGTKVVISDTDHICGGFCLNPSRGWASQNFTRGINSWLIDGDWTGMLLYGGQPDGDPGARWVLGYIQRYATKMNLATAVPHSELADTGFVLANPASEYLVFVPGASATVNLTALVGTQNVEWMNLINGTIQSAGTITAGTHTFFNPFLAGSDDFNPGEALLYIGTLSASIPTVLSVGNRIQTVNNPTTVYSSAGGSSAGTEPLNMRGTIVAGPTVAESLQAAYSTLLSVTTTSPSNGSTALTSAPSKLSLPNLNSTSQSQERTLNVSNTTATMAGTVGTPTMIPNGGTLDNFVSVSLQTNTAGASIYYTTDGTNPSQSSKKYMGSFFLTSDTLVKAQAFSSGYNASAVASAWFTAASNTTGGESRAVLAASAATPPTGTLTADFTGPALPTGWFSSVYGAGGSFSVSGGSLISNGALIGTNTFFGPGYSLEFVATFSATNQHIGFGQTLSNFPWAIFSTKSTGSNLYARSANESSVIDTLIPGNWLGTPHRYRIDWNLSRVDYWIDGNQVATHSVAITDNMRPLISDYIIGDSSLSVSSLQMSPYAGLTTPSVVFDFSLSNSGDKSVNAGSSVANSISVTLTSGSSQSVSLSVSGLPSGVSASFSSISCSPNCSSTLSINASSSAASGTFPITVTGTGGGVSKSISFNLTVVVQTVAPTSTLTADFTGPALPTGWFSSGGSSSVSGGSLISNGALIGTNAFFGPVYSLEFAATFSATNQHIGFGQSFSNPPWAIFSTKSTGSNLYARSANESSVIDTLIPGNWLGAPHRYRIDWNLSSVVYWIDGTQVATHSVAISGNMRPLISDFIVGGSSLSVSSLQLSPYVGSTTPSAVFDFSLSNSGDQSVNAGSSVTNSITAILTSGSSQSISLSASGLPSGAAASFSSASCSPNCSTVLTINTTGATAGNFPITVTAAGGGVTRTTTFILAIALAVSPPPSSASPINSSPGLLGYWRFDEGSGNTASDSSGSGINGTLAGGTTWTTGQVGSGAVTIDGSTGYVELSSIPNVLGNASVSFWMKTNSQWLSQIAVYLPSDPLDGFAIGYYPNDGAILATASSHDSIDTSSKESTFGSIAPNTWYHVVVTKSAGHIQRIYLNGVDRTVPTTLPNGTTYGLGMWTSIKKSSIGSSYTEGYSTNSWSGTIDDVRVYNYQLSDADALSLYKGGSVTSTSASSTSAPTAAPTSTPTLITSPAPVPTPTPTPTPSNSGPIAYWNFDNGTGADASGNGNNGTLVNGPTAAAGSSGTALSFDGVSSYVKIGPNPIFDLAANFTVSAWVKSPTLSTQGQSDIVFHNGWWTLAFGSPAPGHLRLFDTNGGGAMSTGTYSDDTWHQIVAVQSGSTVQTIKIYVDGVSQTLTTGGSWSPPKIANQPVNIGGGPAGISNGMFNGQIDEVRIYNRALSAAEILANYSSESQGVPALIVNPTPTLVSTPTSTPTIVSAPTSTPTQTTTTAGLPAPSTVGNTYYVATSGIDINLGTLSAPFKTIQHAIDLAQAGDKIIVRAGTYYGRLVMKNSGQLGKPITVDGERGPNGEWLTIVDGSDAISGTWTSEGNGIYSIPQSAMGYEPWSLYDNGRVIWKIANQYMAGNTIPNAPPFLTGMGTLGIPANMTITPPGFSSSILFWDGIEAYFGVKAGKVYVRYRDGSNPAAKSLRSARGPSCRACSPSGTGTIEINGKNYITLKSLQITGGQFQVILSGGGGAGSTGLVLDSNNLFGGTQRLLMIGNVIGPVIKNNNFEMKSIGAEMYGPKVWRAFDPTTPYDSAVNIHLYYQNKFTVGETDGYDADIYIWAGGATGPSNIDIGPNNTFYRGGAGIEFAGGDTDTRVHDNMIRWHFGQNIYLLNDSPRTQIYDNLITEGGQYNIRFDNGPSFAGPYYVYRNKFWRPADSGHNFATFSLTSDFYPTVWLYHNSFSGGNECITGVDGTMSNYRVINNVCSTARVWEMPFSNIGALTYNWFPNAGFNANTPVAGDSSGIGSNTRTGPRPWANGSLPGWVLPNGNTGINAGLDLSRPFLIGGQAFSPLPGMTPGYFSGSKPNMGAIP